MKTIFVHKKKNIVYTLEYEFGVYRINGSVVSEETFDVKYEKLSNDKSFKKVR